MAQYYCPSTPNSYCSQSIANCTTFMNSLYGVENSNMICQTLDSLQIGTSTTKYTSTGISGSIDITGSLQLLGI